MTSELSFLLGEGVAGVVVRSVHDTEGRFDRYEVMWNAIAQKDPKQPRHDLTFEVDAGGHMRLGGTGEFEFMSGKVTLHADGTHTKFKWPK
jgi:hypothetical protein